MPWINLQDTQPSKMDNISISKIWYTRHGIYQLIPHIGGRIKQTNKIIAQWLTVLMGLLCNAMDQSATCAIILNGRYIHFKNLVHETRNLITPSTHRRTN